MLIFKLKLVINIQAFVSLVLKCFLIFAISGTMDTLLEMSYMLNQLNEHPLGISRQPERAEDKPLQREHQQGRRFRWSGPGFSLQVLPKVGCDGREGAGNVHTRTTGQRQHSYPSSHLGWKQAGACGPRNVVSLFWLIEKQLGLVNCHTCDSFPLLK